MHAHGPHRLITHGVFVGAAMVVYHAFRVTGGAGGIAQRNRIPFIRRHMPVEGRVAAGYESVVIQIAHLGSGTAEFGVVDINHLRRVVQHANGFVDDVAKLPIGNQHFRLAVLQHEGNGLGIQAGVQGVEYRPQHGDAEMTFQHRRNVWQHGRHGIALADTFVSQRGRQAATTLVGLLPVATQITVNHRRVFRIHAGGAGQEIQRCQRGVIGVGRL